MRDAKVKWGVLGAGGIADRRTLPGMLLAKNCELVAVMEIDPDNAERLRAKYGAKRAYSDEDSLIADDEIQAVYVASPVVCHARQAEKVLRAGKHLLIEKPVAMSAAESEGLCALAAERELKMATGLMMRYNALHRQMKEMVAAGKIGQIVSCHAQFTCWYPDMENCWRQQKAKSGGGAMTDMGIHCIDLIEYISGQRIARVGALSDTMTFSYEVEDAASCLFRLSGGGFGTVDANFNIPDDAASCRLEIYGTKGSFRAEGSIGQTDSGSCLCVLSEDKGYDAKQDRNENHSFQLPAGDGNLYAMEIESFGDSILTGAPVQVPAADAAHAQRVIEAIYRSAECGKFIDI